MQISECLKLPAISVMVVAFPTPVTVGRQNALESGSAALTSRFVRRLAGPNASAQAAISKLPALSFSCVPSPPRSDALTTSVSNTSFAFVGFPSLMNHLALVVRQSVQPVCEDIFGTCQTSVTSALPFATRFASVQTASPFCSTAPHVDPTSFAGFVSVPIVATGVFCRSVTCVNVLLPVFSMLAVYAMFSSYVTLGGPGNAVRCTMAVRFPALPPAAAIAAQTTASHATARRQRVRFMLYLPPV